MFRFQNPFTHLSRPAPIETNRVTFSFPPTSRGEAKAEHSGELRDGRTRIANDSQH